MVADYCNKIQVSFARTAIFVVYFWFGLLKLLGMSPAGELVHSLFQRTLWFMSFDLFYAGFALFEMLIGVLFIIRGFERSALALLFLHLITTAMPLVLLPGTTWQGFLIPTLEGQYIIKNILIISAAIVVGSKMKQNARG